MLELRSFVKLCATVVVVPLLTNSVLSARAYGAKDRRALPITREAFSSAIRSATNGIAAKEELIWRARYSKHAAFAYAECTTLWEQHKKQAETNLLRALAAGSLNSQEHLGVPEGELWNVDRDCLAKAFQNDPKSPQIMLEYGWFIWKYSIDRQLGKRLIERAVTLIPNDPHARTILGSVYHTPGTAFTDDNKALKEVQIAIQIDPTYAKAHSTLASIYGSQNRIADALREKAISESLTSYPSASKH